MKLKVPYFKQFNKHACFVAATAMVLRFYGTRINQKQVYNKAKVVDALRKRRIIGCSDTKLMAAIKNTGYEMRVWTNWKKNVKMPPPIKKWFNEVYFPELQTAKKAHLISVNENAKVGLIRQFLRSGTPVIAEVHSNTWFKTKKFPEYETHSVVIKGYENRNFIIHDPYMPYLGKNGKDVKISVNHFKRSWESPPFYRNTIFILRK